MTTLAIIVTLAFIETNTPHPVFEVVTTKTGAVSIRNKVVNEIMHNPVGPWLEANALYVDQSNLREHLTRNEGSELVVFDVGLGAAANAIATLACARSLGGKSRPLCLISFERDLELLRFALENSPKLPLYCGYEEILKTLLREGKWVEKGISWTLKEGDFLTLVELETKKPHLIFFDPYSPKVNQDMWTTSCFQKIRKISREIEDGGTSLYTYSRATRIRVALMKAGFFVGYGLATGAKSETTEASTDRQSLKAPLGRKWFETWQRSHERYPFDCEVKDQEEMDRFITEFMGKLC